MDCVPDSRHSMTDVDAAPIVSQGGRPRKYTGMIQKLAIVTDAWEPQINGVVKTLRTTVGVLRSQGVQVLVITPQDFTTLPCPTYPSIPLALLPGAKIRRMLVSFAPHALHVATEGPLGWAARNFAIELEIPFTTAYHTRFPEYLEARFLGSLQLTYGYVRWFHRHSHAILVPTQSVKRLLGDKGFENVQIWSRGVDLDKFKPPKVRRAASSVPVFLFAGRVAVEKNVEAFLALDLPGQKWVAGDGPALEDLKERYPEVHYFGFLSQDELVKVYQQADVFVFPSETDTFGLVLLEALATGLPVAAYPAPGPIDVIGDSGVGVLDWDLRKAAIAALDIDREAARAHAQRFSWHAATRQLYSHLRYIPPSVFCTSVVEWSGVRYLDSDADLIWHLPPSNSTNASLTLGHDHHHDRPHLYALDRLRALGGYLPCSSSSTSKELLLLPLTVATAAGQGGVMACLAMLLAMLATATCILRRSCRRK